MLPNTTRQNLIADFQLMIRALCFWGRWALATALLDISTGFARFARRVAPRPVP
jgi:hypothetical protein